MNEAARRFVRKVLGIHLVLLAVVLGLMIVAAHELYGSAREQAIGQARQRQEMLAQQTSAGIESYYASIMDNLDLLRRSGDENTTQPAETQAATQTRPAAAVGRGGETGSGAGPGGPDFGRGFDPGREGGRDPGRGGDFGRGPGGPGGPGGGGGGGRGGRGARGNPFAQFGGLNPQLVWRQLQGRATLMFIYDPGQGQVGMVEPARDESAAMAETVAKEAAEWLKTIKRGEVSAFMKVGKVSGQVIAVPSERGQLVMAAFVPLDHVREQFFDPLNMKTDVRISLVDDQGTIMAALAADSIGKSLKGSSDPYVQALNEQAVVAGKDGSFVVEHVTEGSLFEQPRIIAFATIQKPAGVHWAVVISSKLADTERVVAELFRRVVFWSTFLGIAMTGIMVSTAVLLIRSRLNLERARHEAIDRELHEAREIQKAWLPEMARQPAGVEIAAVNLPASQISGDFYNWFSLPDGRVAVAIGDVTGHGMAAAFLMATAQLLVRTTMTRIHDPGLAMEEINKQLCTQAFRGQFVTMLLMVINPKDGAVEIASAGHPGPLVGQNGVFEPLEMESQLVLGVDGKETYQAERFCLEPGAAMLLYTDGVIEAESPEGQHFSTRHLVNALTGTMQGVKELVGTVVERVKGHARTGEFADDLTLVAVRRKLE